MKNLRSSNSQGEASDSLSRLSLNKRQVQLIGGSNDGTSTTPGMKRGAAIGRDGKPSKLGKGGRAGKAGQSVVDATAAAAATVSKAADEDEELELNAAVAKKRLGATAQVRKVNHTTGRAVRSGITANQKRVAAAKAAKTTKSAVSSGAAVSRTAAATARAAATAAARVKSIAATVAATVASAPVVGIIAAVVAIVVLVISIFSFLIPGANAACETGVSAGRIDPTNVPNTAVAGYGHEQLVNAANIMSAGHDQGLTLREQTIGVMTAMGESSLISIDYGDWETSGVTNPDGSRTTSIGLFQQQAGWGSEADRMDPYTSATLFFDAMRVKVSTEDRQNLAPTLVAHKVQVNANPYHYTPYWVSAQAVVSALSGIKFSGNTGDLLCDTGDLIPGEIGKDGWARPGSGPITGNYGPRDVISTPGGMTQPFHYGLDLNGGGCKGPVWAARDGEVNRVVGDGAGGWIIEIDHGGGLVTWYLHSYADGIFVKAGQKVKAGQQIAEVGSSGMSTGCHLHFEVRLNGVNTDPLPILERAGITY